MSVIDPVNENHVYQELTADEHIPAYFLGKSLFWISKKESFPFSNGAKNPYQTDNFLSARTRLLRLSERQLDLPSAVIIELPFVKSEIKNFVRWMENIEDFRNIPIIFSNKYLSREQFDQLQMMNLVDDIMAFPIDLELVHSKINFLKKVKDQSIVSAKSWNEKKQILVTTKRRFNFFLKRALDILISSLLIFLCIPLFLVIALLIRLEGRGPIFYTSERAGQGYRIFKFFKFRTMVVGADEKVKDLENLNLYKTKENSPRFFKIKDDPRITKVGTFLRNTSIDELPQLFNVLLGDMSIVGNRPLPLYEASTLTTDDFAERFMAPAGITGLWQIKKRGQPDMTDEERIKLDITYARDNSLMKDFWIMVHTPSALFQKTNV